MYVGSGIIDKFGNKTLGTKLTPGYDSSSAVSLKDVPVKLGSIQKLIPAYITLGTSWSTSKGTNAENKAGGSFGGFEFTYRPDAISFHYKNKTAKTKSSVVAYLWKGTYTQLDVPANIITTSGNTTTVTMTDRDRQVLGMDLTGCQGGETSATPDAACIAKISTSLENADNLTGDCIPADIGI